MAGLAAYDLRQSSGRSGRGRLVGVDAARGLALLGMMAVHVLPGRDADGTRSLAYDVAHGRASATFAVLAGVGIALVTGGRRPPEGRAWLGNAVALVLRAALVGLLGLALGGLDSGVAVILAYYAVLFVLAVPLLELRSGPLAGTALAVAVLVPFLSHELRQEREPQLGGSPRLEELEEPGTLLAELLLTGYYPALAWLAYLAAGMAVGRLELGARAVAVALLLGGTSLALGAVSLSRLLLDAGGGREQLAAASGLSDAELDQQLTSSFYGTTPTDTAWWLAIDSRHSSTPLDLLHTTGTALAVLGACLLLASALPAVLVPLAAAGSMTLTLYTGHVLLLSTDLLPRDDSTSYALQVVLALVVALAWRSVLARGPLEAVVSALTTPVRRFVAGR